MHRFWGLLFGSVLLAAFVLTAVSPWMGWWLPMGASSYAPDIDWLYYLILAVVAFFYVLTEVIFVINILRSGAPDAKAEFSHGNNKLEVIWSVIPGVILVGLAVIQVQTWGAIKYPSQMKDNIAKEGDKYLQLGVEARQWEYRMRYASPEHMAEWKNGEKAKADFAGRLPERIDDVWVNNDVHCWKGQKVLMHFKTRDVGHSMFFPNLRLKQDALPGRTIPVWFEPTVANCVYDPATKTWVNGGVLKDGKVVVDKKLVFDLVCTQYCGTRHSLMRGLLYVHENEEDFKNWLKSAQAADSSRTGDVAAKP